MDWLLHEAFCLYRDREISNPTEKTPQHGKGGLRAGGGTLHPQPCTMHTEDKHLSERKAYIRLRAGNIMTAICWCRMTGKSSRCKRAVYAAFVYTGFVYDGFIYGGLQSYVKR